ncbi:hypothetical protein GF407_13370, partial [candidate division KSB1 bacterium]|nr:hypothetical protein [candidate division KSB1 bacterium]
MFRFFIIIIILITYLSCSKSPTEPEKKVITGTVYLEGKTNHSGVKIGIYRHIDKNDTLQSFQEEYPSVGSDRIKDIGFDHRSAKELKYTLTNRNGSFILDFAYEKNIILVIEKEKFGWRYYNLDNKHEHNIYCTLKKTQVLTAEILKGNAIDKSRFYRIDNDIEISNANVEIDSGTIFMFKANTSLTFKNCTIAANGTRSVPIRFLSDEFV